MQWLNNGANNASSRLWKVRMREIKHKVWDKTKNQWITHKTALLGDGSVILILPGGIIHKLHHEHIEVCLFTGLKDKNGVDIYEGDILTDNIVVRWHDILASFCITKKGWMFSHFFKEGIDVENTEVIGNIYQNEGLLQGKES